MSRIAELEEALTTIDANIATIETETAELQQKIRDNTQQAFALNNANRELQNAVNNLRIKGREPLLQKRAAALQALKIERINQAKIEQEAKEAAEREAQKAADEAKAKEASEVETLRARVAELEATAQTAKG